MEAKIKNQTLVNMWSFLLDKSPVFVGTAKAKITDSNQLLAGSVEPNYTRSDLFLVSKGKIWIKRFSGCIGAKDLYVQISELEAIEWLEENGYLNDEARFELSELLKKAVKIEYATTHSPRTISIRHAPQDEPARFLDGLGMGAKEVPWPSNFNDF